MCYLGGEVAQLYHLQGLPEVGARPNSGGRRPPRRMPSQCHLLCPELGMGAQSVGRTPWSARVPLDPLLAPPDQPHVTRERPTGGSAADRGGPPHYLCRIY